MQKLPLVTISSLKPFALFLAIGVMYLGAVWVWSPHPATTKGGVIEAGAKFLRKNSTAKGVWISPYGAHYQIMDKGDASALDPDKKVVFYLERLNLAGVPLRDGTGGTFIKKPRDVTEKSLREAFALVGVGGEVRVAIPSNLKTDKSDVFPSGPIEADETTLWALNVLKVAEEGEEESIKKSFAYPMATMLVVDLCGREMPDVKAAPQCWAMAAGPTRFLDPYCRPVDNASLVEVALVGSASRSPRGLSENRRKWEWVGECLGILVSPDITKVPLNRIGEYIYGSGTGGQDWADSYEAISYLDVDGDGFLEGDELSNVALWVDKNSDGIPDLEEVTKAEENILVVKTKPQKHGSLESWCGGDGVLFKDETSASSWCKISRGVD
jgi:hypothetical protein